MKLKKILTIFSILLFNIFVVPVSAEDDIVVTVPVEIKGTEGLKDEIQLELKDDENRAKVFTLDGSGKHTINFENPTELGSYHYEVRQLKGMNKNVEYDTNTVFNILVNVFIDESNNLTHAVIIYENNIDEKPAEICFENKLIQIEIPKFFIQKVDENGEILRGAEIFISALNEGDKNNTIVCSFITGNTPYELNLSPGDYLLHEESAPEGYLRIKDFKFSITPNYELKIEETDEVSYKENTIYITDKKVTEKPTPTPIPSPTPTPTPKVDEPKVNTSVLFNGVLYTGGVVGSIGLLTLLVKKRKQNEKE